MSFYNIVRHYYTKPKRTIKRGVTLKEAQAHCRDPETSSRTCTSAASKRITARAGCSWFDGYEECKR
jgi:hypothetical protein